MLCSHVVLKFMSSGMSNHCLAQLIPRNDLILLEEAAQYLQGVVSLKMIFYQHSPQIFQVHFEIKHHGPHLKRIIDDQHARLSEAQRKLQKVEDNQSSLEERIDRATQLHNFLEQRLQRLRSLPGAHRKPLSRAEREFQSELGNDFFFFLKYSFHP